MAVTERRDTAGHVIEILDEEFEDFTTEARAYLAGQRVEEKFIGYRLKQGVYGQRQPNVQMLRVKLPMGGVTGGPVGRLCRGGRAFRSAEKGSHHHAARTSRYTTSRCRWPGTRCGCWVAPGCRRGKPAATRCAT